jgi:uncharacterized protein YndB with AHSA1/START domain
MNRFATASAHHTHSVTLDCDFDVPPERVWRAWTDPGEFATWFGTPPYETPPQRVRMDVRPGGEWEATQVSTKDGSELLFLGTYQEVVGPERLVFTFENAENRNDPQTELATVTLIDLRGRTHMVFRQEGHMPQSQYALLAEGYTRFFDRLGKHLMRDAER